MSGCSKRCKHGIVKFTQTVFKLITGTLSKGKGNILVYTVPLFCYVCRVSFVGLWEVSNKVYCLSLQRCSGLILGIGCSERSCCVQ